MKRIIVLTSLIIASMSITACNPRNDATEDKMPEDNTPTESNIPPRTDNELDDGLIDDTRDVEGELKEDIAGEEVKDDKETTEESTVTDSDMTDEEMIDQSDYIAKVKMIKKGGSEYELKVLENLKGSLVGKDLPDADKLERNRAYLVFLKDSDGKIEKTNGDKSYVLLEGDNHVLFEKINERIR